MVETHPNEKTFILASLINPKNTIMIKKLNLARLTSAEFFQFLVLILGNADAANPTKSKFVAQRDATAAIIARLQQALNREQAFALTAVLDAIDKRRDIAIIGFVMWVKSLTMHPEQATRDAANMLRTYLKTMGDNIANQNQQAQTAILSKIVDDSKNNGFIKKAINDLKGTEWIDEIETANNEYISKYQQRTVEMGDAGNEESFSTMKPAALNTYSALTDIIETRFKSAKADNGDTTILQKCIDDINATITQYQQLIKATE